MRKRRAVTTSEGFSSTKSMKKYEIDDGVLFINEDNNNNMNVSLRKDIDNYRNFVVDCLSEQKKDKLFNSIPVQNKKTKLYKFFQYNTTEKKWDIDFETIYDFMGENLIAMYNPFTPLILFSNSYEKEVITINKNLCQFEFPELDEENIYVYALCEKPLSLLKYHIDESEGKDKENIRPIFLLIHIPNNYAELIGNEDIRIILMKIHYFLSIICDFEIIILNKEHCYDQFTFMKSIQNIKSSYESSAEKKIKRKSTINHTGSKFDLLSKRKNDDDDYDFSSDGDDDEEINSSKEIAKNDLDDSNSLNNMLKTVNFKIFKKKMKHIFLIHDKSIHGDIYEVKECSVYQKLNSFEPIQYHHVHFINVNDPITYHAFLSSLTSFSLDVKTRFQDVIELFDMHLLAQVDDMYFYLKSQENWKSELKDFIQNMFKKQKRFCFQKSSDFENLSKIEKKLTQMYPSIDSEFFNECNSIIANINEEIARNSKNIIIQELSISSKNNLDYLKATINRKPYLFAEHNDIIESHINFLQNEYFSIIHELYQKKDQPQVFIGNQYILDQQINDDTAKIEKIINDFETNIKSMNENKTEKLTDNINSGTNYTIRETENIREIQVLVQAGHLKDVIEQDF